MLIRLLLPVVLLALGVGVAEARTPEKWSTQELEPMPRPVIVWVDAEWVQCPFVDGWRRACYWYTDAGYTEIRFGTHGAELIRHEIRHHLDYLDDGRLNGSLCPRDGWIGTDQQWAEICAGPATS